MSSKFTRYRSAIVTIAIALVAFVAGVGVWPSVVHVQPSVTTVFIQPTTSTVFVTPTPTLFTTSTRPEWLPATTQVISWSQASNYVGQYVTVEGTIVYTYYSSYSGTYFLDFHNPYQGYFAAVIFSSGSGSFTCSITDFYLNKEVRVTGTISLYQGQPQIIVSSPSQIEVAYQGFPCS